MKMINPSDDELNAAFAEKVAGCKMTLNGLGRMQPKDADGRWVQDYDFAQSADAVLPWLEKWEWSASGGAFPTSLVTLRKPKTPTRDNNTIHGESITFAKASVIALLRAHGVEIEFAP